MTWVAISSVEDIGTIVVFWYDPDPGLFPAPYHVFKDTDASRIAFSTWAKERVRAVGAAVQLTQRARRVLILRSREATSRRMASGHMVRRRPLRGLP